MKNLVYYSLWLSLVPFAFSLLLDICLGKPGADDEDSIDARAIFFSFSLWLAERRLKALKIWHELNAGFKTDKFSMTLQERADIGRARKKTMFQIGRKYFSWELGFGMCPMCTNVRISIIFSLAVVFIFNYNYWFMFLIPIFSNMFLLIYNKIKI